jgi:antitoxin component YwqK of YwqJK toxin-antitoxin module
MEERSKMKRVLIAILLVTICQGANADYKVYKLEKTARIDDKGKCMDMDGNLLPGKAEAQKSLKDGRKIGTLCIDGEAIGARVYYKSGVLEAETPFKNGELEGVVKSFYESGILREEAPYKNGIPDGIVKNYYENGKLKEEMPIKNGAVDGTAKTYYENGKLMSEVAYKNDVRDGIVKLYYKSGKLNEEIPYKNDVEDGIAKTYYEDGKLNAEVAYKDGSREGEMKRFRENGKIFSVFTYKNNKAISGLCYKANGEKAPFTKDELKTWDNGFKINCD